MNVDAFRNFVRMDPAMFREILNRVWLRIEKYHPLLLGYWGEIQKPDVWFPCGAQHHLPY